MDQSCVRQSQLRVLGPARTMVATKTVDKALLNTCERHVRQFCAPLESCGDSRRSRAPQPRPELAHRVPVAYLLHQRPRSLRWRGKRTQASIERGRGKQLVSPPAPQSSGDTMTLLCRPPSAVPAGSNRGKRNHFACGSLAVGDLVRSVRLTKQMREDTSKCV